MKKLLVIVILSIQIIAIDAIAQSTAKSVLNSRKISETDMVGVWQMGSPSIGAYIVENFQFFKDGKFIYNYDPEGDTRNIVGLKGIYRLKGDLLYFTIKYRIVNASAGIEAGSLGNDDYLFVFDNYNTTLIPEKNPDELTPLNISEVKKSASKIISMKINNRTYHKLSPNPNKFSEKRIDF